MFRRALCRSLLGPPASTTATPTSSTVVSGAAAATTSFNSSTTTIGASASASVGTTPTSSPPPPPPTTTTANANAEPWNNLEGMLLSAKYTFAQDIFDDKPVAIGLLTRKISDTLYRARVFPPSKTANAGPIVLEHRLSRSEAAQFLNSNTANTSGAIVGYDVDENDDGDPNATVVVTEEVAPPLALDIGTRVKLFFGDYTHNPNEDMLMRGTIAKVNGNSTYVLLMANNEIELSVSPERIAERGEQTKVLHNAKYIDLVEWLRPSIRDPRDYESVAFILYQRGWRVSRMYLLERADLAPFVFVSKLEREGVMERAQWERDHHNVVRQLHRERLKDRDIRYALSKYKGTLSCIAGIMVVSYVFSSNLRAYIQQQRSYQLRLAADTLARGHAAAAAGVGGGGGVGGSIPAGEEELFRVNREAEEDQVRAVLRQLDPSHPRLVVFTGFAGSGKSAITRRAIEKERMPAVYVDIRGSEDTLRSVVKAIGVENIDVCGDLLDFIAEAIQLAASKYSSISAPSTYRPTASEDEDTINETAASSSIERTNRTTNHNSNTASANQQYQHEGDYSHTLSSGNTNITAANAKTANNTARAEERRRMPVLSIKLREGSSLERVYREAIGLVSDRHVCHILLEVPLEALTPQNVTLPRLDFYIVPNFNRRQAFEYTQHTLDPIDVLHFTEVLGTNSNDLDELYAAVHQRGVGAVAFTSLKLMKAMRRVQSACDVHDTVGDAVELLSEPPFEEGLADEKVASALVPVMNYLVAKGIILYDPVQDRWLFTHKVLHTAARCCW